MLHAQTKKKLGGSAMELCSLPVESSLNFTLTNLNWLEYKILSDGFLLYPLWMCAWCTIDVWVWFLFLKHMSVRLCAYGQLHIRMMIIVCMADYMCLKVVIIAFTGKWVIFIMKIVNMHQNVNFSLWNKLLERPKLFILTHKIIVMTLTLLIICWRGKTK